MDNTAKGVVSVRALAKFVVDADTIRFGGRVKHNSRFPFLFDTENRYPIGVSVLVVSVGVRNGLKSWIWNIYVLGKLL